MPHPVNVILPGEARRVRSGGRIVILPPGEGIGTWSGGRDRPATPGPTMLPPRAGRGGQTKGNAT